MSSYEESVKCPLPGIVSIKCQLCIRDYIYSELIPGSSDGLNGDPGNRNETKYATFLQI